MQKHKKVKEPVTAYGLNDQAAIQKKLLALGANKEDLLESDQDVYHCAVLMQDGIAALAENMVFSDQKCVVDLEKHLKKHAIVSLMGLIFENELCFVSYLKKYDMRGAILKVDQEGCEELEDDLYHLISENIQVVAISGKLSEDMIQMCEEIVKEENLRIVLLNITGGDEVAETGVPSTEMSEDDVAELLRKIASYTPYSEHEVRHAMDALVSHECSVMLDSANIDEKLIRKMKTSLLTEDVSEILDRLTDTGLIVSFHDRYMITVEALHVYIMKKVLESCLSDEIVSQLMSWELRGFRASLSEMVNHITYEYKLLLKFRLYVTSHYQLHKWHQNFVLEYENQMYVFSSSGSVDTQLFRELMKQSDEFKKIVIYRGNSGIVRNIYFVNADEFIENITK